MLSNLVVYGAPRLILGMFYQSPGEASMLLSIVLGLFGFLLVAALAAAERRRRMQLAAGLLLVVAAYGLIAVASPPRAFYLRIPLEILSTAPRYHYVALIPVCIVLCLSLDTLGSALLRNRHGGGLLLAAWLCFTTAACLFTPLQIDHHDRVRTDTQTAMGWMNALIRSRPLGEDVYLVNRVFGPVPPYMIPQTTFPGWAALFTIFHPRNEVAGRRVFFIQKSAEVRAAFSRGRRTASLLVEPSPDHPPTLLNPSGAASPAPGETAAGSEQQPTIRRGAEGLSEESPTEMDSGYGERPAVEESNSNGDT
jgi:hypothetical protein